jgi:glycosyltransferase involved in cell wall biosynthesis
MLKTSIIICTYNRELYLPTCLEHLKNQNADPATFEIVIVNNNSSDATDSICLAFCAKNPQLKTTYIVEKTPGLSAARNCGIANAKGEVLCFIDDDGFAAQDYVTNVQEITESPAYADFISFGGKVIPCYNPNKAPKWLSTYIDGVVSKVDLGDRVKNFNKKYPAGCNMIFRSSFFEQFGGFNTDLHTRGDDKFIFDKLKNAGQKTLYVPTLYVEHFIDDYRLEKSFIIRLSKIIGESEAIRLKKHAVFNKVLKLIEYKFKLAAALLLAGFFTFRGELSKARYILIVRWYVLIGFVLFRKK